MEKQSSKAMPFKEMALPLTKRQKVPDPVRRVHNRKEKSDVTASLSILLLLK